MVERKQLVLKELNQRELAIRARFVSDADDVSCVKLENGRGRRTPRQRKNISEGMARARDAGITLGRPEKIFGLLKRSDKILILKQLDMGIPQTRILNDLTDIGFNISKASFSRLVKKLRTDT